MERSPEASDGPPVAVGSDAGPVDDPHGPVDRERHPAAETPDPVRRRGGWLIARMPFLVALAVGLYYAIDSYDIGLGTLEQPSSGLWPLTVSLVLIVCSVVGMVGASEADIEPFGRQIVRPLLGLLALCIFVLLWEDVGLIVTGIVVLVFWFRFLARESWVMTVLLAVGATAVAHVLFVVMLGARLPNDVIAELWGGR